MKILKRRKVGMAGKKVVSGNQGSKKKELYSYCLGRKKTQSNRTSNTTQSRLDKEKNR